MKTTKPAPKKPDGAKRHRSTYRPYFRWEPYPESYVHAKGPRSSFRTNERNA